MGVREGINLEAIAEPASGVTLSAENFKADAADSETSLGEDGKVYLVPCTHEMDDTGYTCKSAIRNSMRAWAIAPIIRR